MSRSSFATNSSEASGQPVPSAPRNAAKESGRARRRSSQGSVRPARSTAPREAGRRRLRRGAHARSTTPDPAAARRAPRHGVERDMAHRRHQVRFRLAMMRKPFRLISGLQHQPVCVDLRSPTDRKRRSITRLAAGLLKTSFDELWRREKRRLIRKILGIGAVCCVTLLGRVLINREARPARLMSA